jgi:hypothetical protein
MAKFMDILDTKVPLFESRGGLMRRDLQVDGIPGRKPLIKRAITVHWPFLRLGTHGILRAPSCVG